MVARADIELRVFLNSNFIKFNFLKSVVFNYFGKKYKLIFPCSNNTKNISFSPLIKQNLEKFFLFQFISELKSPSNVNRKKM